MRGGATIACTRTRARAVAGVALHRARLRAGLCWDGRWGPGVFLGLFANGSRRHIDCPVRPRQASPAARAASTSAPPMIATSVYSTAVTTVSCRTTYEWSTPVAR